MKTKSQIAVWATVAITFVVGMSQPTIVHQIAVFVSGLFAMLAIGLVFLVRNWPETAAKPEAQHPTADVSGAMPELSEGFVRSVQHLRGLGFSDEHIANGSGFTPEQIKAIK